jgi:hypothetical protein
MALDDSLILQTDPHPFQIEIKRIKGKYYGSVSDGVCFSSFSFNTGSFLPIENLEKDLPFEKNSKFFIEINMMRNLQPSGNAIVKCAPVNTPESWPNYPELFDIQPKDEYDDTGRVIKYVDGKSQTKCYVLIGYAMNDESKNGIASESEDSEGEEGAETGGGEEEEGEGEDNSDSDGPKGVVQLLKHNFILLASVVSGVAVVFPAPYFEGHTHELACLNFKTKNPI